MKTPSKPVNLLIKGLAAYLRQASLWFATSSVYCFNSHSKIWPVGLFRWIGSLIYCLQLRLMSRIEFFE